MIKIESQYCSQIGRDSALKLEETVCAHMKRIILPTCDPKPEIRSRMWPAVSTEPESSWDCYVVSKAAEWILSNLESLWSL